MIGNLNYNDSSIIIQAFLNNKDFVDKMLKEYLDISDTNKMNDFQAFLNAYNAIRSGTSPLPKESIDLIQKNRDEYIKIINELNNKNKTNSPSNSNTNSVQYSNPVNSPSQSSNQTSRQTPVNNDIDYYNYNNGDKYSSTYAKGEIEKQIQDLDEEIKKITNEMKTSTEMQRKKSFYTLQELTAKKESLDAQLG